MGNGYDLNIEGLQKVYQRRSGATVRAIDDISLRIKGGEFVVLLGPSGCGKTTLLRCIAGLETPDGGAITIDGRPVYKAGSGGVPPERRRIGMMFQSYALWPHMTIYDNIRFPLKMQKADKATAEGKIGRVLDMMRIGDLAKQYPNQLSGGQQQRVALARAVVCSENLILFDEPLSNIDAKVRDHLRTELGLMQKRLGFTAIYVTHDQDEAMALADRIVVLGEGRIWQMGAPQEIYRNPRDARVAAFIGSANLLEGRVVQRDGSWVVATALGDIASADDRTCTSSSEVVVMSRLERWRVSKEKPSSGAAWPGTVLLVTHLGSHTDYTIDVKGTGIRARDYADRSVAAGDAVWCAIDPSDFLVLDPAAVDGPRG